MASEWITAIDKRPCDRSHRDIEFIIHRLRRVQQLSRLPNHVLHQLALAGYYEDLEKDVILFRQGDLGSSWYAVLAGSLDVRLQHLSSTNELCQVSVQSLGVGDTFGESVLDDAPRQATVVTRTTCELLRVEQRDFRLICQKNKELLLGITNGTNNHKNGFGPRSTGGGSSAGSVASSAGALAASNAAATSGSSPHRCPITPDSPVPPSNPSLVSSVPSLTSPTPTPPPHQSHGSPLHYKEDRNPYGPITESPSGPILDAGWCLWVVAHCRAPGLARDRGPAQRRCMLGHEMVDWLISLGCRAVQTRHQAIGVFQALLEEGVLLHVPGCEPFRDKPLLYRFRFADEATPPDADDLASAEESLSQAVSTLASKGPDALLRMLLTKPGHDRTQEELEIIYEELVHTKALAHLSNTVKRELAAVIMFEAHPKAGTVLFNQGDEGRSWYIILRGSADVLIHGRGIVHTLRDGDDFGKLALINDAPRAATIILKESNVHLLRVDKDHFNRILRDVEANTVRLEEHGREVLVLQKNQPHPHPHHGHYKYTVMAGTPQKMLEHLLETRLDGRCSSSRDSISTTLSSSDPFLEDFLLTHIVFMPTRKLVAELASAYRSECGSQEDRELVLSSKRRVVQFVHRWVVTIRQPVFDDPHALAFLEELASELESEGHDGALQEEASLMHYVTTQLRRYEDEKARTRGQKWKLPPLGQPVSLFGPGGTTEPQGRAVIRPQDDIIFRVYCADHTYCTLRLPVATTAETIKMTAADKLKLRPCADLILAEVRSNGERVVFRDDDLGIATGLSLNGRIFVSPKDHLDALTCLAEQEQATEGVDVDLELFSTKELAYHMTIFDWDLFWSVHEYELIYHTFGRSSFGHTTANLDVFLRRFNEIQFWVVTELCLAQSLSKRVQLLRKFIKLAAYCKELQNLNAFFAIVMGLSNLAVSRLSLTWDKLPSKVRKLFTELEALTDPSRNHRAYRISVGKLQPPVVPFMPLLLKDMTFTHDGNETLLENGLVNFEKMHMLAQTMRTLRYCRSRHLVLEPPSPKSEAEVRTYISSLRVIDNQRVLTSMSQKLEPRRA